MKPTLQFRLSQHLTLTPQLQQSIRLLQLSTVELNQEIERMLMENPILEREDAEDGLTAASVFTASLEAPSAVEAPGETSPADAREAQGDEWQPDYSNSPRTGNNDDEDGDRTFVAPELPSLRQHLNEQLSLTNLPRRDRALIGMLIDALDDDGYLTQPLEEIAELLPPQADADIEDLGIALRHLQNMEPAGVGARSPSECLLLQIRAMHHPVGRAMTLRDDVTKRHTCQHHATLAAPHDKCIWRRRMHTNRLGNAKPPERLHRIGTQLNAGPGIGRTEIALQDRDAAPNLGQRERHSQSANATAGNQDGRGIGHEAQVSVLASDIRSHHNGAAWICFVSVQPRIVDVQRRAVRAQDLRILPHVEEHMRMIERRTRPHALQFFHPDENLFGALIIGKMRRCVVGHVGEVLSGGVRPMSLTPWQMLSEQ